MKQVNLKQRMREVRFTTEHTLTPEQRNKLILEKMERARIQHKAMKRLPNKVAQ